MSIVSKIDQLCYPQFSDNWDDFLFREKILSFLTPDSTILDVGAGAGIVEAMNFRGLTSRSYGIDVDHRVQSNPYLDEGVVASAEDIPFPDNSFDLVLADNVMEHLSDPYKVFAELFRVIKPGGKLLFKTPNFWHYMPLVASVTPINFHKWLNAKRGRSSNDTFPTLYRCNSLRSIKKIADKSGFELESAEFIEGRPEYLRVNGGFYILGLLYERLVNSFKFLAEFRILIIATLTKPNLE